MDIIAGKLYIPFIVNDYRGFGFTSGIQEAVKEYHCTPFNQIEVQNIQASCFFRYESEVYGVFNLFLYQITGIIDVNEVYSTTFKLIGNSEDSLITLTNKDYSYVESYFDIKNNVLNLNCYGGLQLNNLNFSIAISGFSVSLSTSDAYFPISYRMNISLQKILCKVI